MDQTRPRFRPLLSLLAAAVLALAARPCMAADAAALAEFTKDVRPLLVEHCYDCHGDGSKKGGVAFDEATSDEALVANHELWGKVQKSVRAGLMPPPKKGALREDVKQRLDHWIKYKSFALDPKFPDPGRITLRRLNRDEYRNTVRELLGVDYRTDEEFPADDTGHGFDNIGDALTVSPLLLEKYLTAAQQVVFEVVPTVPKVVAERSVAGRRFRREGQAGEGEDRSLSLSYYEPATVTSTVNVEQSGTYRLVLDVVLKGRYAEIGFDYNRCQLTFSVDGTELLRQEHGWEERREVRLEFERQWEAGEHRLTFDVKPLTNEPKRYGELEVQVNAVKIVGPLDPSHWVRPKNYERFFGTGGEGPDDAKPEARRARAAALLGTFATRAFRRPVDAPTVDRLVALAERVYTSEGKTFESGVAHAMVGVLASPRFLFREEFTEPLRPGERFPRVDEYALASRLSYFLWSSMPDDELIRLAAAGQLRGNLDAQVKRMLADGRSKEFIENFAGQWLQARDVEGVPIDPRRIADRETLARIKFRNDGDRRQLRSYMREEVERYFEHVVREDRSLLELIDSDYTFLNERLATLYGIPDVKGNDLRRVTLPKDSPRGGLLTSAAVLMVTSNPTRTSPVKRGLFVLENFLGTPPPPPPPDIPSLEDATEKITGREPTLRETLELHRASPACSSCHNRMDPIGLAFENFSPIGMWRDKEMRFSGQGGRGDGQQQQLQQRGDAAQRENGAQRGDAAQRGEAAPQRDEAGQQRAERGEGQPGDRGQQAGERGQQPGESGQQQAGERGERRQRGGGFGGPQAVEGPPIDPAGKLVSGKAFKDVRELKRILASDHRPDFYACVTEKLLTYALGRGVEHYDVETVDQIVARLERDGGRFSSLLAGVIESAPFQQRRPLPAETETAQAVSSAEPTK